MFSIIIPVYNTERYLRECLDSVLAQTFGDWEAICVDDGSTDGSAAILDEYAAKDSRFRVIHQANAGVSAARNAALDVAKGEWIGFLDADDLWTPDWLEKIIAATAQDGVDWVRTGWTDWGERGRVPQDARTHLRGESAEVFCGEKLVGVGWRLVSRCGFPFVNFYLREAIGNVRFPVGIRFREDALFGFKMVLQAKGISFAATSGYIRRERSGSATFSTRRCDDTINLLTRYLEFWKAKLPMLNRCGVCEQIVEDSTFWVHKDVCEWFWQCREMTPGDAGRVWQLCRELLNIRAISCNVKGGFSAALRWRIFLATGLGRVFRMNKINPLGRFYGCASY